MNPVARWAPAAVIGVGAWLTVGISPQHPVSLRAPLDSVIPMETGGFSGRPTPLSRGEVEVAGVTSYLSRTYSRAGGSGPHWWSLYVGYYSSQTQGKTIHSPKNCLPGSGWEALQSSPAEIAVGDRTYTVNRYLLRQGTEEALVLYWYQGRGRVAWNEYQVKWHLLRDAGLHNRTEEALVRIVVPVSADQDEAFALAARAAAGLVANLDLALPSWP